MKLAGFEKAINHIYIDFWWKTSHLSDKTWWKTDSFTPRRYNWNTRSFCFCNFQTSFSDCWALTQKLANMKTVWRLFMFSLLKSVAAATIWLFSKYIWRFLNVLDLFRVKRFPLKVYKNNFGDISRTLLFGIVTKRWRRFASKVIILT